MAEARGHMEKKSQKKNGGGRTENKRGDYSKKGERPHTD